MTRNPHLLGTALLAAASLVALAAGARAADTGTERPLVPLAGKLPPAPPAAAYGAVVRDKGTLVALGKALFWDQGVGSRGDLACASCHFHAGADPRTTNALDPGLNVQPGGDATFGDAVGHRTGSGAQAGPNYALKPGDFPFHRLADPANRNSAVLYDTDDVTSSAGAFNGTFASASAGAAADGCANPPDGIFHTGAGDTRRVEPRNTPSAINAVFMRRNFWDGRASNTFNGVDPFGAASIAGDPTARVLVAQGDTPVLQAFQLPNMSAASQAVGPPLSGNEMSCAGRRFADIGRRLLTRPALAGQRVAADDSVLAGLRGPAGLGLASTYADLVQKAFQPAYWQATGSWAIGPNGTLAAAPDAASGRSQAELNFSLFFGLAIDAYERTLVSDQSPFDKGTLSADERAGLEVFKGKGKCSHCHDGPLLSKAATFRGDPLLGATTLAMAMGAGGTATYDLG